MTNEQQDALVASHADLADIVTEFRSKADGALFYGIPPTEMTRDELLSVCAMAGLQMISRYQKEPHGRAGGGE